MKASPLMQLENIEIESFNYCLTQKKGKKRVTIDPDDLDFVFIPQQHKKNSTKKRLLFKLFSKENAKPVNFNISIVLEYFFIEEKSEDEHKRFIVNGLIPQAISFIRGYLFSVSSHGPVRILIPTIDVLASVREQIEMEKPE